MLIQALVLLTDHGQGLVVVTLRELVSSAELWARPPGVSRYVQTMPCCATVKFCPAITTTPVRALSSGLGEMV